MFSNELVNLIFQVATSWQVIAATVVLVLFLYFVIYIARSYHRPRSVSKSKPKPSPKKAKDAPADKKTPENDDDELGLDTGESTGDARKA